jgi:hypothetical protein
MFLLRTLCNCKPSGPSCKGHVRFYHSLHVILQMKVSEKYMNVDDYMFQDQRLETFNEWPFNEDSICTARKV